MPNSQMPTANTQSEKCIKYEVRARILKALAHPTRLLIVEELSKREMCVCEITDLVGADVSTVSKHLAILKNAGIVCSEKRGSWVYYSLRCPCVLDFFKCVEGVLAFVRSTERGPLGV